METPDYIQTLQAQIAQMSTDESKGLYLIDKKTLERLIKILKRDETLRNTMRNRHRDKNPEGQTRKITTKKIMITPVMLIP